MKKLLVVLAIGILLTGCSFLPSMDAGAIFAEKVTKNQAKFQKVIVDGATAIDCATGFTIGASINRSSNAKIELAKKTLLEVVDVNGDIYKKCYKFGVYSAYSGAELEWSVQWLLELLGTIN